MMRPCDASLRLVAMRPCDLLQGLVAGTSPIVCADLYKFVLQKHFDYRLENQTLMLRSVPQMLKNEESS